MIYQKRSIPVAIILTLVTCGIYQIYWVYCIARDFYNSNTPNRVDMSPGLVILLDIVTCGIYGYYMFYKWGKQTPEIFAMYGRYGEDRSILYLVLALTTGLTGGITWLVAVCLIQSDFNQLADFGPPAYPPYPPTGGYGYPQGVPPPPAGAYPPPPPQGSYGQPGYTAPGYVAPSYTPPPVPDPVAGPAEDPTPAAGDTPAPEPPPAPTAGPQLTLHPEGTTPPQDGPAIPSAPPPPPFYPYQPPAAPDLPPPPGSPYNP